MSSALPTLLNWLQDIGYPALWCMVFVAAAGVPLPTSLILLAAGAFAALGEFNVMFLALVAFSASVCGDNLGYLIGRKWGSRLLDWLELPRRHAFISPRVVARSRIRFKQQGGWAVFLSRFLFSALGGIINLLAGADPYPYRLFLLCDATGEVLGVGLPLLLGYAFGASWDALGEVLGAFSNAALALLIFIILSIYLIQMVRHVRAPRTESAKKSVLTQKEKTVPDEAPAQQIRASGSGSGNLPL